MMGERQVRQEALFYGFSLEEHVPANHLFANALRHSRTVSSRTPKAAAMSGLGQPESVSRMARARSASARSRDRPSSTKARLCSSFAETGDLPAMIRTPAQIGAGNHRPRSLARPGKPA